jgi:4-amino-4-deoxy-L-arabinose transferase-like glycosyltransferase
VGLSLVLVIAAVLRFWNLTQNGFGHSYYAAAVRSMLSSWSNFFFASFDPAGFVSVDKPPVAFWIQAFVARVCGFSGLSVLAPQALMGVLAVALVILMVRRTAGSAAGLTAGLALAVTPISVAVDRSNLPDTCLVLVLLIAVWSTLRATTAGSQFRLLLAAMCVGIAFNIKMLAAFVFVPPLFGVYLFGAPLGWRRRLGHLTAAASVLVVVSLSWPVAVDLTPPDRRPYVGGSRDNSALELAIGLNGVQRVIGMFGTRDRDFQAARAPGEVATQQLPSSAPGIEPHDVMRLRREEFIRRIPGFGGEPGLLRLSRPNMAGQVMWLFPLAAVGLLAAALDRPWRLPISPSHQALLLWAGWFLCWAALISLSRGIIHDYYTVMLAPPLAALTGIGASALFRSYRRPGWQRWLLPVGVGVSAAWQLHLLSGYPGSWARVAPVALVLAGLGTAEIAGLSLVRDRRWRLFAAAGACLTALAVWPLVWSLTSVLARGIPALPMAGPRVELLQPLRSPGRTIASDRAAALPPRVLPGDVPVDPALLDLLRSNRHGERFLVAAPNSHQLAPIVIATGDPVMAIGGFGGADPILDRDRFARLVADGHVRYVLDPPWGPLPLFALGRGPRGGVLAAPDTEGSSGPRAFVPGRSRRFDPRDPEAMSWVREHCSVVDRSLWQSDPGSLPGPPQASGTPSPRRLPGLVLYDCGSATLDVGE